MRKILKDVLEIMEFLKQVFVHPFEEKDLVFLSGGIIPTTDIKDDLRNVYSLEKKAMDNSINERLSDNG